MLLKTSYSNKAQ